MRFLKRSPKKPEEISVREIRFLGEQDGPSEQVLKNKLVDLFHSEKSVTRAYLARFDLGSDESAGVILGLKTQRGPDKRGKASTTTHSEQLGCFTTKKVRRSVSMILTTSIAKASGPVPSALR